MSVYEYSSINRLESPHNYMYTPYGGRKFLQSYRESREVTRQKLLRKYEFEPSFVSRLNSFDLLDSDELIGFIKNENLFSSHLEIGSDILKYIRKGKIETRMLSEEITRRILNDKGGSDKLEPLLSAFAKKYEVFKKIFSNYDSNLRKTDSEFQELRVYLHFNFSFFTVYHLTHNLKFLNVGIKMCDMLSSVPELIKDAHCAKIMLVILKLEEGAIQQIVKKKNLTI